MTTPPQPADPGRVRAGNADRERVVGKLNDAFAEGRLDVAELDERVAAAYAAKTVADLRGLTADLPGGDVAATVPRRVAGPPASRQSVEVEHPTPGADLALRGALGLVAVNVVIWAAVSLGSGHLIYFWPVWVAIPLVLAVVRRITGVPGRDRHRDRYRDR